MFVVARAVVTTGRPTLGGSDRAASIKIRVINDARRREKLRLPTQSRATAVAAAKRATSQSRRTVPARRIAAATSASCRDANVAIAPHDPPQRNRDVTAERQTSGQARAQRSRRDPRIAGAVGLATAPRCGSVTLFGHLLMHLGAGGGASAIDGTIGIILGAGFIGEGVTGEA